MNILAPEGSWKFERFHHPSGVKPYQGRLRSTRGYNPAPLRGFLMRIPPEIQGGSV